MRHAHLIAASVTAAAFIMTGWGGGPLMTDLCLLIGGIFAGHVLTELLNDPSE